MSTAASTGHGPLGHDDAPEAPEHALLGTVDAPRGPALVAAGQARLLGNYRQAPIVLARGSGSELWDVDGRRYLDLCAGVAVSSLGHAHPRLSAALAEQAGRLIQASNYFYNESKDYKEARQQDGG